MNHSHPTETYVMNNNGKRSLSSSSLSSAAAAGAAAAGAVGSATTTTTLLTTTTTTSSSSSSRIDKKGAPLTEQKLRRLEKNRLSARECRRRKREATEQTQRHINLLEGENLRLRLQLQVGEEAEVSTQDEQQRMTQVLDDLLKSGASEAEIYTKIEEYKEKFADYGRDRRSAIEFHLRNIERLLMPTQTTSVVLTTLGASAVPPPPPAATIMTTTAATILPSSQPQEGASINGIASSLSAASPTASLMAPATVASSQPPPTTPNSNLDAKTLFRHLVEILQVTPEQAAALKDSRLVAKEMDECLKESLGVLEELRRRLAQCGEDLENEFDTNVRSILTPTQAAKFLVWVANNKACMHMLNELWNRVYPQQQPQVHDPHHQQHSQPPSSQRLQQQHTSSPEQPDEGIFPPEELPSSSSPPL